MSKKKKLKELIKHMALHDSYRNGGWLNMTEEQRELYSSVTGNSPVDIAEIMIHLIESNGWDALKRTEPEYAQKIWEKLRDKLEPLSPEDPIAAAALVQEELEAEVNSLQQDLRFYQMRVSLLQSVQSKFRDPERQVVCDIIANGLLWHEPERYEPLSNLLSLED